MLCWWQLSFLCFLFFKSHLWITIFSECTVSLFLLMKTKIYKPELICDKSIVLENASSNSLLPVESNNKIPFRRCFKLISTCLHKNKIPIYWVGENGNFPHLKAPRHRSPKTRNTNIRYRHPSPLSYLGREVQKHKSYVFPAGSSKNAGRLTSSQINTFSSPG